MPADEDPRKAVLRRLRRIEGQVRGIIRMVEEGKDCREVLNQVAAVRSAMERVGAQIITHRMKECLRVHSEDEFEKAVGEAVETFLRFTSSMD
ncbi:metal-sensitive transcriptional regulator [Candidatus Solincola sp.]|jgi:DNA-binding FrmR family transcriptional regulator|nr:metal-sensitive transcriptional regulator [Actinomycetota bacterium]MDI7251084.1 metal-sensitive transcriptional regulator [Actinomycetota bacterium]